MASVVVIHAAEDTLPARALAEKLRQAKLTVTLERPPGDELREAVKASAVTIALWSPRSVGQAPLVEEVQFAKGKSKVVHATMQSAALPDPFRNEQAVNLTGWRGEDDFGPWRELADAVTKKAGVPPLPPAAPRPPSGFFQPGRPDADGAPPQNAQPQQARAPQQRPPSQPPAQQRPHQQARPQPAPRATSAPPIEREEKKGGAGMLIAIAAVVVLALGGGGAYWFMTQNNAAQTTSLESVDLSSASAIREFLAGNPSDADRERAEEALRTLEQQSLDAARDANTIEAFEQFLRDFPDSSEALFVQGQIQQLRLQEAEAAVAAPEAPTGPPITSIGPTPDPDLVPPGTQGPAQLTPPPSEPPAEEPETAPTP